MSTQTAGSIEVDDTIRWIGNRTNWMADGTNEHCRSLNEPTREMLGTERVEVVSRWRFELEGGTTITTPWLTYEED